MIIKSLELNSFRNYKTLVIDFEKGTNILYGDNAQGKTNILEAIYVSGTTKSHKGSKDKEMIQFGSEESHIRIFLNRQEKQFQIDIHLKKNRSKYCLFFPGGLKHDKKWSSRKKTLYGYGIKPD